MHVCLFCEISAVLFALVYVRSQEAPKAWEAFVKRPKARYATTEQLVAVFSPLNQP